jgi:hypothetical protein
MLRCAMAGCFVPCEDVWVQTVHRVIDEARG